MDFVFVTVSVMFALLGVCVGSFLNVVVYRVPRGMSIANPPSHCTSCGHKLAWHDNIPLLSYIFLGGKCRYCHRPYSSRYFWVELLNGLLWLCCAFMYYDDLFLCSVFAVTLSVLLTMSLCDYDNLFIPDSLQIALAVVAILSVWAFDEADILSKLWGLLGAGGFFLAFYGLSFVVFGREGMGFADVKLMASLGFLLGWKYVSVAVIAGIVVALFDIALQNTLNKNKDMFTKPEYPFAPYLAWGGAFAIFFASYVIDWYVTLFF